MTVDILRSRDEIDRARKELRRRNLSCMTPPWLRYLRDRRLANGIAVGDHIKSWDLLRTIDFLEQNLTKNSPVLDIGAYASEILCVLRRMGYSDLSGVDLNPGIKRMPDANVVRYETADFMHTPFANASFAAVTAVSVIEHGFDSQSLFAEVTRLLRPGGYFVASFDYWPQKINTAGIDLFGLDWRIFSEDEVQSFVDEALAHDLNPCGPLNLMASEPIIHHAGRSYTFAWLALKKDSAPA